MRSDSPFPRPFSSCRSPSSPEARDSAAAPHAVTPDNATIRAAGPQHWCGTNGINCTEPAIDWDEYAGFDKAIAAGAHINGYIGHDEPATLFYSNKPGSGNDVTYQMRMPTDPPTAPRQDGSGGTDNFQDRVRRTGSAW